MSWILGALGVAAFVLLILAVNAMSGRDTVNELQRPPEPPAPSRPPIRFEFTRRTASEGAPAAEQLALSQDQRDAEVEELYELLPGLDVQTDLPADPAESEHS